MSKMFGDIYYFYEDGWGESRYVFLEGNGFLGVWVGKWVYMIGEMGFGIGFNFFVIWYFW